MIYEMARGESGKAFAAFLLYANSGEATRADSIFEFIASAVGASQHEVHHWYRAHSWERRLLIEEQRAQERHATLPTNASINALLAVLDARAAQRQKWSADHDKDHGNFMWTALFAERLGKVASYVVNDYDDTVAASVAKLGALCLAYLESRE